VRMTLRFSGKFPPSAAVDNVNIHILLLCASSTWLLPGRGAFPRLFVTVIHCLLMQVDIFLGRCFN
jgi:hypothetical protein